MSVTLGLGLNTSRTVEGASFNLHSPHTEVVLLTMHRLIVTHKSRNAWDLCTKRRIE